MILKSLPYMPEQPRFELLTSRQFPNWMADQQVSLAFTTYQSGKLFLLGLNPDGEISVFERTFNRCMGLWADGQTMWMSQDALDRLRDVLEGPHGVLRVLGPFDPYIVGYAKRDLDVPDHLLKRVNAGGGMLRPCVLIDGRLVATWDRRRRAHGLSVRVTCFEELSDSARTQLQAEFDEIGRFLETEISWSLTLDPAAARSG